MEKIDKKTIEDVCSGISSRREAREVVDWLSSSIEGQQTLSEMLDREAYLIEQEMDERNTPSQYRSQKIWDAVNRKIRVRRLGYFSAKAAVALIPFFAVIGLTVYMNSKVDLFGKPEFAELYVPKGEKTHVVFQDGSEAYLNADSRIKYPKKFGLSERIVYLDGEAYFKVAGNKRRPFIVKAGSTSIKVLGTSFNVNAYRDDEKIRVVLDEGSVVFNTFRNQYRLSPGQQIVYSKAGDDCLVQNLSKSTNMSQWKENVVYLYDTPLSEVLKMLERRYNISFSVKDARVFNYSFTLTTRETDIKTILLELQKIAPVKFVPQKNEVEVSLS